MNGENWLLITDEPVEFENLSDEAPNFKKVTDCFRGISRIYLKLNKQKPKDVNM